MARATVRLDNEDRQLRGRAAALREALQRLAAEQDRKESLDAFLKEWEEEDGPLSDEEFAAVAKRCSL